MIDRSDLKNNQIKVFLKVKFLNTSVSVVAVSKCRASRSAPELGGQDRSCAGNKMYPLKLA